MYFSVLNCYITAPSSSIPTAADKGKAPMVDDFIPADLLSEQERVLKNLHDSQLGEELAKKIHAEQKAEFARQQEELAQKAQAERVASPTEPGLGLSDQRRRELDAAQLIYTEADWDNMNERLGMLLIRKRRELAEQSRVKPMSKTQQKDYTRDFVKNNRASVYNQGWTMKKVKALSIAQLQLEFEYIQQHLERSNLQNFKRSTFKPKPMLDAPSAKRANPGVPHVPAASLQVLASVPAAPTFAVDASVFAATTLEVPAAESRPTDTPTASAHVSVEHSIAASTHDSGSDDDPLPYVPYAGWEKVPSLLGSVHAYHDMAGHTKHFTTLHELLHMEIYMCYFSLLMMRMPVISGVIRTASAFTAVISILVLSYFGAYAETWIGGKDVSNPLMVVMVCQKPLGYFSSPMIHVPRVELVFNPPGYVVPAGRVGSHLCCCVSAGNIVSADLCYPKNDRKDIGKLGAKGDIGFFIGYSADSCAYRIYNRRTKKIMETTNVSFDELSAMAFEQRSSKPGLQSELDLLFEAMYDDYIGGQPSATVRSVPAAQEHQAVDKLNPNAMVNGNTFINPFANPSTSAAESSSS
nr:integrase, catalytic region, zinc finger, CCHC-type, peptidase aspartic, catalytic [Tanacetum cinerariifolium]